MKEAVEVTPGFNSRPDPTQAKLSRRLTRPMFTSVANLCALDMLKAFDNMNHYGLFIELMNRCLPLALINVLILWYGLCVATVPWNNFFSSEFYFECCVGQSGI